MDEKFLYHIWDEGHLKPELRTASGKSVRVIFPGQFNRNRGPDFVNVTICLDGVTMHGDVEIHLNTYDWIAHKHQEDCYYNSVILHVVFQHSGYHALTVKQNAETAEILELQNQLSEDIGKLICNHGDVAVGQRPRFCDLLSAVDSVRLESILHYWGLRRFQNKGKRFNAGLLSGGFDQILYEGIMEAMGYDKNKLNMLRLAQSIPLSTISAWQNEGITALQLLSIFIVGPSLIQRSEKLLPESFRKQLEMSYEEQRFQAKGTPIDWQLFRVRPSNHPVFRMISLAPFLFNAAPMGLMNYLRENLRLSEVEPSKAVSCLKRLFGEHAIPGTESFPQPGDAVLRNLIPNVLLPVFHLYAEKLGNSEEAIKLEKIYSEFHGLSENYITRFMLCHISPSHHKRVYARAIFQQGLIELYYRYCQYHFCAECADTKNIV